jgi:hypothetical protein
MGGPPRATVSSRRRLLAGMILAAVLGGCNTGPPASASVPPTPPGSDKPASAAPAATPSEDTAVAPPGKAAFSPITLKGKGKKVAKFKIPSAAALAQASYTGSNNFTITSVAADGSPNDLLVNTIGTYKGTVLFDAGIDQHSVAFKVEATGSWTIVIKSVADARDWNGSGTVKGSGDDVVQISPASSGLVTLDLSFKGKDDFALTSFSIDGGDLLANEIGNFTGQVLLPDGSFLLSVRADGGTWSAKAG